MKFLTTIFWGCILGQVTYYLGASLSRETYNLLHALIASVATCFAVFIFQRMIPLKKASSQHSNTKE